MTTVKSQKGEAVGVKMATSNINVHQPQAYDAALTKLFAKSVCGSPQSIFIYNS